MMNMTKVTSKGYLVELVFWDANLTLHMCSKGLLRRWLLNDEMVLVFDLYYFMIGGYVLWRLGFVWCWYWRLRLLLWWYLSCYDEMCVSCLMVCIIQLFQRWCSKWHIAWFQMNCPFYAYFNDFVHDFHT